MSKTKSDSKPAPPKRPQTAFFIYLNENRSEVKKKHPDAKITEITGFASNLYKALSESEKKAYQDKADAAKAAYDKAMKEYKDKHGDPPKKARKSKKSKSKGGDEKKEKKARKAKKSKSPKGSKSPKRSKSPRKSSKSPRKSSKSPKRSKSPKKSPSKSPSGSKKKVAVKVSKKKN